MGRTALIRLASSMPRYSPHRRTLLAAASRKPKPSTITQQGLPTNWYHGTSKEFTGPLKPNRGMGGACVWLGDRDTAISYAGSSSKARIIEVELDTSTKVVDLSDVKDPIVLEFIRRDRQSSNMFWAGRVDVTDEEMKDAVAEWDRSSEHYSTIEARRWSKTFFREMGVDALLVKDFKGWAGHGGSTTSLCVLNLRRIKDARPTPINR